MAETTCPLCKKHPVKMRTENINRKTHSGYTVRCSNLQYFYCSEVHETFYTKKSEKKIERAIQKARREWQKS